MTAGDGGRHQEKEPPALENKFVTVFANWNTNSLIDTADSALDLGAEPPGMRYQSGARRKGKDSAAVFMKVTSYSVTGVFGVELTRRSGSVFRSRVEQGK